MQVLVAGAKYEKEEERETIPIDFVRLQREEVVQPKLRKMPEKPPQPDEPPPPRAKIDQTLTPPGTGISVSVPNLDLSVSSGFGSIFDAQTTAVIPLARVQPQYPRQALVDGIEGWVEVEFTITELGLVQDPRVLRAQPRGIFENAALRAIVRWKFKPKVENGVPIPFRGNIRLEFNIEDPGA
jgi:protein TonB